MLQQSLVTENCFCIQPLSVEVGWVLPQHALNPNLSCLFPQGVSILSHKPTRGRLTLAKTCNISPSKTPPPPPKKSY